MSNFKLLIDSREQHPLEFKHKLITEVITTKLDVGDYGAELPNGQIIPIFFERKSIGDLYSTLSHGYERFKQEIERSKGYNYQIIIIVERNLSTILTGFGYSSRTPQSIVYQLFTILARYKVWTVFCRDRNEASEYITQFFIGQAKEYLK